MLQKSKIEQIPKISRKLIFGPLFFCVAFQRHYGDPWSILDETKWSLTSPRAKRISGSKNFRSPPQKDFFNTIRGKADVPIALVEVTIDPAMDIGGEFEFRTWVLVSRVTSPQMA